MNKIFFVIGLCLLASMVYSDCFVENIEFIDNKYVSGSLGHVEITVENKGSDYCSNSVDVKICRTNDPSYCFGEKTLNFYVAPYTSKTRTYTFEVKECCNHYVKVIDKQMCYNRVYEKFECPSGQKCVGNTCVDIYNCDDKDGYYGDKYCKNDDVYREYRDYYYKDFGCDYTVKEKKIEDCKYGCEDGECIDKNCDDLDGFYGEKFCKDNDVYRIYKDYEWDGEKCSYTQEKRKIEDCSYGCENGECISGDCEADVESIQVSDSHIDSGEDVDIDVSVSNQGTMEFDSGYVELIVDCGSVSDDKDITSVLPGETKDFGFTWDTDGCSGNTNIKAVLKNVKCDSQFCTAEQEKTVKVYVYDDDCEQGWLNEYRCDGNDRERKYQYSDCSTKWKFYEHCSYGCDDGYCEDRDCDDKDGYYGDKYCKYGDVYRDYRNYYWDGDECEYTVKEKKIEDCKNGCDDGECIDECHCDCKYYICDCCKDDDKEEKNCESQDGYVGDPFCKHGNSYRTYRNYEWKSGSCIFTEKDVLVKECSSGCDSGSCINMCDDKDFYTQCEWSCLDGDTRICERTMYDYYYHSAHRGCEYSEKDGSYTQEASKGKYCLGGSFLTCSNECDGYCASPSCYGYDPDCAKDGSLTECSCQDICSDWIECGDGIRKRECVEYYNYRGKCTEGDIYTVYSNEMSDRESIDIGSFRVFNGVIFGENYHRVVLDTKGSKAILKMDVEKSNSLKPLVIEANGETITNKSLSEGHYEFDFTVGNELVLEFKPVSSGWQMWSPNYYDLDVEVTFE